MNKAEKAIIALLAAQLELMIASEEREAGGASAEAAYAKAKADARKLMRHPAKAAVGKRVSPRKAKG